MARGILEIWEMLAAEMDRETTKVKLKHTVHHDCNYDKTSLPLFKGTDEEGLFLRLANNCNNCSPYYHSLISSL